MLPYYRRNIAITMKQTYLLLAFVLSMLSVTALAQKNEEIEVVNIENPAVRAYMADSTYNVDKNFANSVITKYKNEALYGDNLDWPAGKLVTWTPTTVADSIADVVVLVSETKNNFKHAMTYYPDSKNDTCFVIRNSIPGHTYFYKVEEIRIDNTKRRLAKGAFRAEGQVRMIQARGAHNIRDIGGWPTQYGVPIQYGHLYRSASLDVIKPSGRHDLFDNLGIMAELDLRGEAKLTESKLGPEADYLLAPLNISMKAIVEEQATFKKYLTWIIERMREGKAVDWHCAIGCDRCGMVSFLIEGLLGMYEDDLGRDFELSTLAWQKFTRKRSTVKSMLTQICQYGPADDLAQCFYNYWLDAGMEEDDLCYFLSVMLDLPM